MKSFILGKTAQLLLPTTVLFSLYLLLRGHNQPGGGFSAGLVASLAVIMQALAFGREATQSRLGGVLRLALWMGLLLMLVSGLMPVLAGEPFLTHHHVELEIGPGRLPLSTTLLFDAGVYASVVGTTSLVLAAVASGRSP